MSEFRKGADLIRKRFVLILLSGLFFILGGCLEPSNMSYYFNFEPTSMALQAYQKSMDEWSQKTGVDFVESVNPREARMIFILETLPPNIEGYAYLTSDKRFNFNTGTSQNVLTRSVISLNVDYYQTLEYLPMVKLINHEIGHVMTNSGHSPECPSTMHPYGSNCGTENIDEASSDKANENLEQGWLNEKQEDSDITVIQVGYFQ